MFRAALPARSGALHRPDNRGARAFPPLVRTPRRRGTTARSTRNALGMPACGMPRPVVDPARRRESSTTPNEPASPNEPESERFAQPLPGRRPPALRAD